MGRWDVGVGHEAEIALCIHYARPLRLESDAAVGAGHPTDTTGRRKGWRTALGVVTGDNICDKEVKVNMECVL